MRYALTAALLLTACGSKPDKPDPVTQRACVLMLDDGHEFITLSRNNTDTVICTLSLDYEELVTETGKNGCVLSYQGSTFTVDEQDGVDLDGTRYAFDQCRDDEI